MLIFGRTLTVDLVSSVGREGNFGSTAKRVGRLRCGGVTRTSTSPRSLYRVRERKPSFLRLKPLPAMPSRTSPCPTARLIARQHRLVIESHGDIEVGRGEFEPPQVIVLTIVANASIVTEQRNCKFLTNGIIEAVGAIRKRVIRPTSFGARRACRPSKTQRPDVRMEQICNAPPSGL